MYVIAHADKINTNFAAGEVAPAGTTGFQFNKIAMTVTGIPQKLLLEVVETATGSFSAWRTSLPADVIIDSSLDDLPVLKAQGQRWHDLRRPEGQRRAIDLATRKLIKIRGVDKKTQNLIDAGYTHNGVTLSMSETAQLKWLGHFTMRGSTTYPRQVPNKDNTQFLDILDADTVVAVFEGMTARIATIIDLGTALKVQINEAETKAQLDAIVDNRT
jgi:hypothetical protein